MIDVDLSVVIPFFNEEDNIVELHEELLSVLKKMNFLNGFEILYVDDGSTDDSGKILDSLDNCRVFHLQKSFGQTAGVKCGIDHAKGKLIATMDGDLQNNPNDIPMMLEYLKQNNLDMLVGWRKLRKDSFLKKFFSRVAYLLRTILLKDGIHDAGCGLKVFKKRSVEGIELFGEMHRFLAAMVKANGYKVGEVVVDHRQRKAGRSKYTWKRAGKGFLDMLSVWFWERFAVRPLHLLGGLGLVVIGSSFLLLIINLTHSFTEYHLLDTQNWIIASFLMFILGVQLILFGLVADVVSKSYLAIKGKRGYVVRE